MYTVVIPTYCNPDGLRNLIEDIKGVTPEKYMPARVIIVDDASPDEDTRFIGSILTTSALKIDTISLTTQVGYPEAANIGIMGADTEIVILIHSDVRLDGGLQLPDTVKPVISDPLGLLWTKLSKTDPEVAAVSPFILAEHRPNRVYGGHRMISRQQVPFSQFRKYYFEPLRQTGLYDWKGMPLLDHCCVALRYDLMKKYPLSNQCGHFFCFDDWCATVRTDGYYLYLTADTVAYHPVRGEKPPGSLSIPSELTYSKGLARFQEKWIDTGLWEKNAAERIETIRNITPNDMVGL